jgi:hypothetical protein
MIGFEGATDPEAWGRFFGALGPGGFTLVMVGFGVLVVIAFALSAAIALTGIPRFKIPGLAWTTAGLWHELHGLRGDLRAYQRGDTLPDLDPLSDSVPPPATQRAPRESKPVHDRQPRKPHKSNPR